MRGAADSRASSATALAVLLLAPPGVAAWADAAQPLCRGGATDDTPRPIPDSLVPASVRLFGLEAMPEEQVRRSTLYRCAEGRVLVCNLGANLPCGKANTRSDLPQADAWCAENAGSDFIPMYVTGHDTIYRWRCDGTKAAISASRFRSIGAALSRGSGSRSMKRRSRGGETGGEEEMSIKALACAVLLLLASILPARPPSRSGSGSVARKPAAARRAEGSFC